MSSIRDDISAKALQKSGQKLNEIVELVCVHHMLVASVSSLPSTTGLDERKRLAALQMKIETLSFDFIKATKLNKKKHRPGGCRSLTAQCALRTNTKNDDSRLTTPGFKLQCNSFRESLELFRRDLYKLLLLNAAVSSEPSGLLAWEGMNTGFHCQSKLHEIFKALKSIHTSKEDNRTHDMRIEDVARKITVILKSLVANVSIQVWTVENYSSIAMESWNGIAGASPCLGGLLQAIKEKRIVICAILSTAILLIAAAIVGLILFTSSA